MNISDKLAKLVFTKSQIDLGGNVYIASIIRFRLISKFAIDKLWNCSETKSLN